MAVLAAVVGEPNEWTPAPDACVRYHLAERRLRTKFFPPGLTRGPAWLLLTNLYEAHLAQRRETVGGIGLLAELASATTQRWIDVLEANGLVQLRHDPLDARRKWIELTPRAVSSLREFFLTLSRLWASR